MGPIIERYNRYAEVRLDTSNAKMDSERLITEDPSELTALYDYTTGSEGLFHQSSIEPVT